MRCASALARVCASLESIYIRISAVRASACVWVVCTRSGANGNEKGEEEDLDATRESIALEKVSQASGEGAHQIRSRHDYSRPPEIAYFSSSISLASAATPACPRRQPVAAPLDARRPGVEVNPALLRALTRRWIISQATLFGWSHIQLPTPPAVPESRVTLLRAPNRRNCTSFRCATIFLS